MLASPSFTDGTIIQQAQLNNLATNIDVLCQQTTGKPATSGVTQKPVCKLILSGSQAIGSAGVSSTVVWGSAVANSDNMWSSAVPDRMLIRTPGWYRIRAQAMWAAGAGGPTSSERVVQVMVNGNVDPLNVTASSNVNMLNGNSQTMTHQVVATEQLAAGAALYVSVWQNTTLSLSLLTNGVWGTWFTAAWESPF